MKRLFPLGLALQSFLSDRRGGTVIEYCLLAVMIAMCLIGAATIWGDKASAMYQNLANNWNGPGG